MKIKKSKEFVEFLPTTYEVAYINPQLVEMFRDNKKSIATLFHLSTHLMAYDNSIRQNNKPLNVGEIANACGVSQSTCYEHIKQLKKMNLIKECKVGNENVMFINPNYVRRTLPNCEFVFELFKGENKSD